MGAEDQCPHVADWEKEIAVKYGKYLVNTGGNDPVDLMNDLANPKNKNFMQVNIVRFTLAVAVSSQVSLLRVLEKKELI